MGTDNDLTSHELAGIDGSFHSVAVGGNSEWEGRALRVSTRLGAWGLFAGFGAFFLDVVASLPYPLVTSVSSLGLVVGGLGVTASSAMVLRRVWRSLRRLTLAAAVGIPFGLATALVGLRLYLPPSLDGLFPLAVSAVLVLAPVLAVLLGLGVFGRARRESVEEVPQDSPERAALG